MPLNLVCCKNWHAQCHIQCLRCHFCCKTVGLYYFGWGFSLSSRWGRVDKAVEDQLRENPSAWKVTNTRISELSQILPSVSPWSSCWQRVVGVQLEGTKPESKSTQSQFLLIVFNQDKQHCASVLWEEGGQSNLKLWSKNSWADTGAPDAAENISRSVFRSRTASVGAAWAIQRNRDVLWAPGLQSQLTLNLPEPLLYPG